jgi:hypothetical protein
VNAEDGLGCRYGVILERRYLFDAMAALSAEKISFTQLRGGNL